MTATLTTTAQAAKKTGYSQDHINKLIRENKVNGQKIGNAYAVDMQSLKAWKKSAKQTMKNNNWTNDLDLGRKSPAKQTKAQKNRRKLLTHMIGILECQNGKKYTIINDKIEVVK